MRPYQVLALHEHFVSQAGGQFAENLKFQLSVLYVKQIVVVVLQFCVKLGGGSGDRRANVRVCVLAYKYIYNKKIPSHLTSSGRPRWLM